MVAIPGPASDRNRKRRLLLVTATVGMVGIGSASAGTDQKKPRALREMQIHKVPELGLAIWVENQPAWETELIRNGARPSFVAQSPDSYHPPTVMNYASWPDERVTEEMLESMAVTAIRRASLNFGLRIAESRGVRPAAATHGKLHGYEASFAGQAQGVAMDVRIFVGQASGGFPVVLSIYTLRGKLSYLSEQIRRAWGRLDYLPRGR